MSFTVTGQAPARNTHAYLYLKCNACGAEREARASRARAGKVSCSCGETDNSLVTEPVQDPAPSTGRIGQADPQIQNFPGTLAHGIEMYEAKHGPIGVGRADLPAFAAPYGAPVPPAAGVAALQADFKALEERLAAYATALETVIAQQAETFAAWQKDMTAKFDRLHSTIFPPPGPGAVFGPLSLGQPLEFGLGEAIKGTITARPERSPTVTADVIEPERPRITYRSVTVGLPPMERLAALWDSHRIGAALADAPFTARTAPMLRELKERFEVIIAHSDALPPKDVYAALQPYLLKMKRSIENWDNPNYDPTDYPINTETSA